LGKVSSKDSANVIASGKFVEFKDGGLAYGNRGYRWKDVSRKYSNWKILMRNGSSGGAEATLEFQVISDGLVNILISAEDYDAFTKLGWKKSSECSSSASTKDRFIIIKKALPAGRYSVKTNSFMTARVVRRKEKEN
ncbi:MAG: hypothetical protein KAG66_17410, partial [Methylococcales bacterium]|nr:hypothetical protein [Methylococcales bacterium]